MAVVTKPGPLVHTLWLRVKVATEAAADHTGR